MATHEQSARLLQALETDAAPTPPEGDKTPQKGAQKPESGALSGVVT